MRVELTGNLSNDLKDLKLSIPEPEGDYQWSRYSNVLRGENFKLDFNNKCKKQILGFVVNCFAVA